LFYTVWIIMQKDLGLTTRRTVTKKTAVSV
jgi:hypothetical protein